MKHLPSILLAVSFAPFMIISADAADQNTYRPGRAYLKTAASSAMQCEQQCQGDAQCRGWNFVRPNMRTKSGICEFNELLANPIPSPISISGTIRTSVDGLMSQAVTGGTHTVRVGTPAITKPMPRVVRRSPSRIVKREPIAQSRAQAQPNRQAARPVVRPATHRRPLAPQQITRTAPQKPAAANPRTPRTYGGQTPQKRAPQKQMTQQQQYRQQFLNQKRGQLPQPQTPQRPQAALRMQEQEKANQHRQAILRAQQAAAMQAPTRPAQLQRPQMLQTPMQQNALRLNQQQQQQFSYGSLHDDLTQGMTTVPRPKTAPDNLANPDAPISTSRAAPTKPVQTQRLNMPAYPALAGG